MFWIMLGLGIVAGILYSLGGYNPDTGAFTNAALYYTGDTICLAMFVIYVIQNVKTSQAFGHGGGFAVGLILFNFIFMLILGFGSSKYVGPAGQNTATSNPKLS